MIGRGKRDQRSEVLYHYVQILEDPNLIYCYESNLITLCSRRVIECVLTVIYLTQKEGEHGYSGAQS